MVKSFRLSVLVRVGIYEICCLVLRGRVAVPGAVRKCEGQHSLSDGIFGSAHAGFVFAVAVDRYGNLRAFVDSGVSFDFVKALLIIIVFKGDKIL